MDRVENVAAGDTAKSATWNGVQDQAASLYQVAWSWRGRRPTLACDGSNLIVGGHKGCSIGSTQAGSVLMPADSGTTLALSGLTGSTWYYLYAYDDSSSPGYEWSTTAPDSSLSHKTGDETRAYLGCFYATGASAAKPFWMRDGEYLYRVSAIASTTAYYAATASATFIDLALTAWMPPHARLARLRVRVDAVTTTPWEGRTKGDSTSSWQTPYVPAATSAEWRVDLQTDSSQTIQHKSAADASETIYVVGFDE